MVLIYTTCQNTEEAKKLGRLIIEKKLAACVNIYPIESIYSWKGALKEDKETALLIKTIEVKLQGIEDLIQSNHSYSVPCIAVIDVKRINRAYKEWLVQCIE